MPSTMGTVTFVEPIRVSDPGQTVSAGTLKYTLTGAAILILPSDVSYIGRIIKASFKFRWEPYATILAIRDMWRAQIPFSANLQGIGSGRIIPTEGGGVSGIANEFFGSDCPPSEVEGFFTDKWSGQVSFTMELSG